MQLRSKCALALVAGLTSAVSAQGTLEFQVSPALQENWSSSIDALPGQSIDIRLRITYTGAAPAMGLGSVWFQPAISNWDAAGPSHDTLSPFVTTGGSGTTPLGDVPDSPGLYGRISPYGWRFPGNGVYTLNNTAGGVSYLRIAQADASNWIGGSGNTTGGRGMNVGQPSLAHITSTPSYPYAYAAGNTDLVVLKLNITLSSDTDLRTLLVSTAEGFAGQAPNLNTTVKWYATAGDNLPGSLEGNATYQAATINVVPSPWTTALLGAGLTLRRRRR